MSFAKSKNIVKPLPASECSICEWITVLAITYRAATIKAHVDSLHSWHVDKGLPWSGDNPRVKRVLRGIWRSQDNAHRKPARLAISAGLVAKMAGLLNNSHDHVLLKAALWTAMSALLRIGEVAPINMHDERIIRRSDVVLASDLSWFQLTLRRSKTDFIAASAQIKVTSTNACQAMHHYLALPIPSPVRFLPDPPLFTLSDGSSLLRKTLLSASYALLRRIGIDPASYKAISFRAGGASSLAAAGAGRDVIKTMGRWKSDAVDRYIDPPAPDVFNRAL